MDTVEGMVELIVLLGTEPSKLAEIIENIYENPELLLDAAALEGKLPS